jgi:uncharacterized protein involved in outer membrane biogenesis
MYRVLLIIGGLAVGLITAMFTVPLFIDWTRYRGILEEEASRLVGRDVRVSGNVNLRLLPAPYIRFEKIRVADAQAGVGEPLLRADDFTIWLAVAPLFSGTIQATEIELRKPVLSLVMNDKGGGNWSALGDRQTNATFLPTSVRLDAFRITNGTVALFGSRGEERGRLERINGELSAESLAGPWRLNVALARQGQIREIRLSTSTAGDDGSIRIKGTMKSPETGASVTVDGNIRDIFEHPRLEGELSASIPLMTTKADGDPGKVGSSGEPPATIDVKSQVKADTTGAELTDLALSYEQGGRPQLASGRAKFEWREGTRAHFALQSRWLDFDRLVGGAAETPLVVARQLAANLDAGLPFFGDSTFELQIDQATIGGDIASRLSTVIERRSDTTTLRSLSATLPGGARVHASGKLTGAAKSPGFAGDVDLRGSSLIRFMDWSTRSPMAPDGRRDGSFALAGHIELDAAGYSGRGLALQYAGNSLTGEFNLAVAPTRRLSLVLEGAELDVTPWLDDAGSNAATAIRALARRVEGATIRSDRIAPAADLQVRLRLGRLVAGATSLRDVVTDIRMADGNLSVPLLRMGAENSWSLELRGDIANVLHAKSKGALTGTFTAQDASGLIQLAELAEVPGLRDFLSRRQSATLPASLAARLSLGHRADGSVDLAVDGPIGGGRFSGSLKLDGAGASWRERAMDLAVTVESPTTRQLVKLLAPDAPVSSGTAVESPSRVVVRAIGTARNGLASFVTLDTIGLDAEYRGRISVTDTADPEFDGEIRVRASDVGRAVKALSGRSRSVLDGITAIGSAAVSLAAGKGTIETSRMTIGGTVIGAKLSLATGAAGTYALEGAVTADRLSLPWVLATLTDDRVVAPGASLESRKSSWSEAPFDLSALAALDARVRVEANAFDLAPGVRLASARLDVTTSGGVLRVGPLAAEALGGKLTGTLEFKPVQGGARLVAKAQLDDGRLEAGAGGRQTAAATGLFGLQVDVEGTGASPRGLMAALRGKGELGLQAGQLMRMNPIDIRRLAEGALVAPVDPSRPDLRNGLTAIAAETRAGVPLPRTKLAIDVRESAVRLAPMTIETPDGRLTGATTIDLDSVAIDSEWRVEAKTPAALTEVTGARSKATLAPITFVWTAPLAQFDSRIVRLDSDAFEQDITVRRMERSVEELERLRKRDEEHARREADRIRAERERLGTQWQTLESRPGEKPSGLAPVPPSPTALPKSGVPEGPASGAAAPSGGGIQGQSAVPQSPAPTGLTPVPRPQPAPRPTRPYRENSTQSGG